MRRSYKDYQTEDYFKIPGEGAIEFLRELTEKYDFTRDNDDLIWLARLVLEGELDTYELEELGYDLKRIKTCTTCGYLYRDNTRPNNSKTCSKQCKTIRDTVTRKGKRQAEGLEKPTRKSKYYMEDIEYSYWRDEREMTKYYSSYETPASTSPAIEALLYGEYNEE